jgi:hypothetical protein
MNVDDEACFEASCHCLPTPGGRRWARRTEAARDQREGSPSLADKVLEVGGPCRLADRAVYRSSSDFGYRGFHFFQAEEGVASANLEDPTLGVLQVGYYAVDRNTADIWDAGFCQEISSPSLTQLQAVIRKHIGLTDTEYRKLRKPGPFCEPGYPRLPASQ